MRLFERFMTNKLYIAPGMSFASNEPGWFRIVFSMDSTTLEIGMKRY